MLDRALTWFSNFPLASCSQALSWGNGTGHQPPPSAPGVVDLWQTKYESWVIYTCRSRSAPQGVACVCSDPDPDPKIVWMVVTHPFLVNLAPFELDSGTASRNWFVRLCRSTRTSSAALLKTEPIPLLWWRGQLMLWATWLELPQARLSLFCPTFYCCSFFGLKLMHNAWSRLLIGHQVDDVSWSPVSRTWCPYPVNPSLFAIVSYVLFWIPHCQRAAGLTKASALSTSTFGAEGATLFKSTPRWSMTSFHRTCHVRCLVSNLRWNSSQSYVTVP